VTGSAKAKKAVLAAAARMLMMVQVTALASVAIPKAKQSLSV